MRNEQPRVLIVGAGVIGASLAYHLARRGARVQLVEEACAPARGVTGRAFGWVNLINGEPANAVAYDLRRAAVADFDRLEREAPAAFAAARRGSLVWRSTVEATQALVEAHQEAGAPISLIGADAIAGMEPHLRHPPQIAAWSPNDMALSPEELTKTLVDAAVEAGADAVFGHEVRALEVSDARVTGVRLAQEVLTADIVVIAAGPNANHLTSQVGLDVGLEISPALLLRFMADRRFLHHILREPDFEVRQTPDNMVLIVKGYDKRLPDNGPDEMGARVRALMQERFQIPESLAFHRLQVGARPMFKDGTPRLGFAAAIDGLYMAVGHPGLILAPLMGRLAADEIITGQRASELTYA